MNKRNLIKIGHLVKRNYFHYIVLLFLSIISIPAYCDVDVNFSGELKDIECQISAGSLSQDVSFPDLDLQTLEDVGKTELVKFKINISSCSVDQLNQLVKFTWKSESEAPDHNSFYVFENKNSSVVNKSLMIKLFDKDETAIKLNTPLNVGKIVQINSGIYGLELVFGARVFANDLTQFFFGKYKGTATFDVEYN